MEKRPIQRHKENETLERKLPSGYEVKLIHVSELVTESSNLLDKIETCNNYTENNESEDLVQLVNDEIKKNIRCCIDNKEENKVMFKHFEGFSPYRFFENFSWSKREGEKAKDIHEPDYNASKIKNP